MNWRSPWLIVLSVGLLFLMGFVSIVLVSGVLLSWIDTPVGMAVTDSVVIQVCRDGTLVVRRADAYLVVRRGALRGWPAIGPNMCSP